MHVPGSRDDSGWRSKACTLTRNNLEFAGVVVYFFTLAVIFAITIIVMLCRTGSGTNERAASQQPEIVAALSDLS
jgi:branched-subunit amino acid ABC-type transport system permease component